jgi:hypothetical protein
MQPTYLPWLGYFSMINSVDEFVFLDDVQFAHRTWQHRNRILTKNGADWITVPVTRSNGRNSLILEVGVNLNHKFPHSHLNLINESYKKSQYFEIIFPGLREILSRGENKIVNINIELIKWISGLLGVDTKFKVSSEFKTLGAKAEKLLNIAKATSANTYISAQGSSEYLLQFDGFEKNKIAIKYFEFVHPTYMQQFSGFTPQLSIIDALFNMGPDWVRQNV